MVLSIIENSKIKSNYKAFERFLENFHDNEKQFTIDCESINLDYFNSDSNVTIRHRKPSKESIYYTSIYKDKNEFTYFFGLARDPVIATSSYMDMGAQIVPKLVAILNTEDSSKSSIVFAEDSEEFNNVILLRIDCSQLSDLELKVLKNKNRLTRLEEGKGFIKFGPIGNFNTLRNIRNFISNVDFEYDNGIYAKIINVSIPLDVHSLKPDRDVLKDRFYNSTISNSTFEDVIDVNLEEEKEDSNSSSNDLTSDSVYDSSSDEINVAKSKDYSKIVDNTSLNKDFIEDSYSDLYLFKKFIVEENEVYMEMSIPKDEFFKIMKLLHYFVDSYRFVLDFIEVLDMDDGLLNITSSILNDDVEMIKIIEDILKKNGFDYLG